VASIILLTYFQIAELSRKPDVCALCEEYTSKALDYLNENNTQQEIIDILHNTCHQLPPFNQKVAYFLDLLCFCLDVVTVLSDEKKSTLNLNCAITISHMLYEFLCFFCIAQCITLVDYYAPLFFLEIASIQPQEFCHKIHICHLISYISSHVQEDSCGFCNDAVSTLLAKLKDSDTKVCNFIFLLLK